MEISDFEGLGSGWLGLVRTCDVVHVAPAAVIR
eukprot:SAG31_NODE_39797_length_285_cov_1.080645_2_plen_32_part_01